MKEQIQKSKSLGNDRLLTQKLKYKYSKSPEKNSMTELGKKVLKVLMEILFI